MQFPRNHFYIFFVAILLLIGIARIAPAAPGSIDPTFDPGLGISPMGSLPVRVIFPLPDGSFLLGGFFTNYNGIYRPALAKVLENGSLDETFAPDPMFSAANTEVWSIAQQPDGKFMISGITGGAQIHAMIVRLNTDGSLDPTFAFSYNTAAFGMAVDVRPDGLISCLIDGPFGIVLLRPDGSRLLTSSGNSSPFGLFTRIRTSAEGHTFYSHNSGLFRFGDGFGLPDDVLFNGGGGMTYDFDFQSDGRIVCINSGTGNGLRRYFPNGVIDTNFQAKISGPDIEALVCLPDDKILVGGTFTTVSGVARRNFTRLNADGTLDTNFVTGAGPNSSVYAIAPVANGKALIAGKFTSYDGLSRTGIARIFLDTPTAPAFVSQPKPTNVFEGQAIRLSAAINAAPPIDYRWKKDGQFIPGATNPVFYLFRTDESDSGRYSLEVATANGANTSDEAIVTVEPAPTGIAALDPTFAYGEGAARSVNAYLPLAGGKSLIGGNSFSYDGQYQPALVRLNADGSLDTSLNFNLPPVSTCTALARLADGTILAGFLSALVLPKSLPVLMRLNPDGSPIASFFPNSSADILAIAPLPDGKALIGGSFTFIGGTNRTRLARLNSDCSIDESFDVNALQLTKVLALAVQPDGKILVADQQRLLRLSEIGVVETDWPLATVRTIALQPDQKILIGGHFAAVNGMPRTNLARLNADMSVDANFTPVAGTAAVTSSAVLSFAIQSDEKIIVAGNFSELAGSPRSNIGRLLPNGALDSTFNPDVNLGTATTRVAINIISMADDGALTIGGLFSRVNNFTHNSLARVHTTMPAPILSGISTLTPSGTLSIKLTFPPEAAANYSLESIDAFPGAWQDAGPLPNNTNTIEFPVVGSQRFYRLKAQP